MTSLTAPAVPPKVAAYLARLDAALGLLPHAAACDIAREIEVHISDALAGRHEDAAVDGVLAALGSPEMLAENYRNELLFTRAGRSFSPPLLLHTAWRWARSGAKGVAVFLVGLAGYGVALGLTLTVLMKPLIPAIGLWVGRGGLTFGLPGNTEGMREVLGQGYVPVTTLLAFSAAVGTTQALRWLIRKHAPPRPSL